MERTPIYYHGTTDRTKIQASSIVILCACHTFSEAMFPRVRLVPRTRFPCTAVAAAAAVGEGVVVDFDTAKEK